jgi:hypothetical protein
MVSRIVLTSRRGTEASAIRVEDHRGTHDAPVVREDPPVPVLLC